MSDQFSLFDKVKVIATLVVLVITLLILCTYGTCLGDKTCYNVFTGITILIFGTMLYGAITRLEPTPTPCEKFICITMTIVGIILVLMLIVTGHFFNAIVYFFVAWGSILELQRVNSSWKDERRKEFRQQGFTDKAIENKIRIEEEEIKKRIKNILDENKNC